MMYLPRLCEHCLNPTCVAACPSGAIYKREDDGIVLIDQEKCRGWRMCVSGCPYKKIYYNWSLGQIGEVHLLLSAHRGRPSDRLLGDLRRAHPLSRRAALRRRPHRGGRIHADEKDLYEAQLKVFLDPNDPAVIEQARKDGIPEAWLEAAKLAGLQDGDGVEGRFPAPPRIPHAADGLVCAAAVAAAVGRPASGKIGVDGPTCRTCARCASRCATSPTC
jgi:nitrate reductase beta subunit